MYNSNISLITFVSLPSAPFKRSPTNRHVNHWLVARDAPSFSNSYPNEHSNMANCLMTVGVN
jgi:hypothetical protein